MHGKVGAPPGNRVHWLIDELNGEFTRAFKLSYNYKSHNYRYARYKKRTLIDEFLIVRTSKRCYRVTYFNNDFKYFYYFSCRNYKDCACQMKGIYSIFKHLERYQREEDPKN